jgi:nicotinamide mononucleotide transporter
MSLQGVFLFFQFYGLYQWRYGSKENKPIAMQIVSLATCLSLVVAAIILFASIIFILKHSTDSTTIYADATITALSLIAQWMMSKKYLQHWVLWIIIDLISINLYQQNLIFNSVALSNLYAVMFQRLLSMEGNFK